MASIGIIANPASGKDIRRLVSYATKIKNKKKDKADLFPPLNILTKF